MSELTFVPGGAPAAAEPLPHFVSTAPFDYALSRIGAAN